MTKDTSSYRLKADASCYAGGPPIIEDTISAMKRPLLREDGVVEGLTPQAQQHHENVGFHIQSVLIGVCAGLIIQAITLGSFVFLLQRWGRNPRPGNHSDIIVYTLILVSSQLVYFCFWIGFVFSLTRRGALYFGKKFDLDETVAIHQTERFVFVRSVSLFMGIVLGSFAGMIAVDSIAGLPGNAMPLFITFTVAFGVFYLMLRSYDWVNLEESTEEEELEEGQQENRRIDMA
jgi:hypothetical protein